MDIVFVYIGIFRKEFLYPVCMLFNFFVGSNILSFQNIFLQKLQLFLQTCRKHGKSHNLDQTNIFFFDVMVFCMRMVNAKRMLFCGDIVSQSQIQLKHFSHLTGNRSNGIVGLAICLCIDEGSFICISSPYLQYMRSQIDQALLIFMADTQNGKRPFDNACLHILISRNCYMLLNRRFCHSKGIMSALEMIVA